MSYYKTCPRCGAHLDPGETCDCMEVEWRNVLSTLTIEEKRTLLHFIDLIQSGTATLDECKKLAASGATNTESGKAEQVLTGLHSTSIVTKAEG